MVKRMMIMQALIAALAQLTLAGTALGMSTFNAEQEVRARIRYYDEDATEYIGDQEFHDVSPPGLGDVDLSASAAAFSSSASASLISVFAGDGVTVDGSTMSAAAWGPVFPPDDPVSLNGNSQSRFWLRFTPGPSAAYIHIDAWLSVGVVGDLSLHPESARTWVRLERVDDGVPTLMWEGALDGTDTQTSVSVGDVLSLDGGEEYVLVALAESTAPAWWEYPNSKSRTASFSFAATVEPVPQVDIDLIWFKTEKNSAAGELETEPFDVGALVFGTNLNSVKVTSPAEVTEDLEPGPGYWVWDREEKYATLEDLRQDFPTGYYEFTFNEGEASEDSATVFMNPEEPMGFANIEHPLDGATDVQLSPTFLWDSCSGYGDTLLVVVGDIVADDDLFLAELNIDETSWTPGLLPQGSLCDFEVSVQTGNETSGTTENGDAFNFLDVFQWSNRVTFTTESPPSDLDIDWICMTSSKTHTAGAAVTDPWKLEIWVYLVDAGSLDHIDIYKPGSSTPFVTLYEDGPVRWGDYNSSSHPTLESLQIEFPPGNYIYVLCDSSNTILKTVVLDYSGIPDGPTGPANITYPSHEATDIPVNPTITWEAPPGDVGALIMTVQDDETDIDIYETVIPSDDTISWTPGPLLPERQYDLELSACAAKDWSGGALPTTTVGDDTFAYLLMIEHLNETTFRTGEAPGISATLEIDDGTITTKAKWITCNLWLPPGNSVTDIDLTSVRLGGGILPVSVSVRTKQQMLVAKFAASDLNLSPSPDPYVLTVSGQLVGGPSFSGSDGVTVIEKGGKKG